MAPLLLAAAVLVAIFLPGTQAGGVSGGFSASSGSYPWQAAVIKHSDSGNAHSNYLCGATVIHPFIALTSASCIHRNDPDGDNTDVDPEDIRVVSGRTRLSGGGGTVHTVRNVWSLVPGNPAGFDRRPYSPISYTNDYTYLTLDQPVSRPIKLAGPDERFLWQPGRAGFVTGWGSPAPGAGTSDYLRAAKVYISSDVTCRNKWGGAFYPAMMVCAGFLPGTRGSCDADGGSALANPALGGVYRLSGIVSFGRCGARRTTDVYVRVAGDTLRKALVKDVRFIEDFEGIPRFNIVGSNAKLPFRCAGSPVTIAGTRAREVIVGTPGNDIIQALAGPDKVYGRGGDDVICGGPGGDLLVGGPGADQLYGNGGRDVLKGGRGVDQCLGGRGHDKIRSC